MARDPEGAPVVPFQNGDLVEEVPGWTTSSKFAGRKRAIDRNGPFVQFAKAFCTDGPFWFENADGTARCSRFI
jgi:hypothetical protein